MAKTDPELDWRSIFVKYAMQVIEAEGVSFLREGGAFLNERLAMSPEEHDAAERAIDYYFETGRLK